MGNRFGEAGASGRMKIHRNFVELGLVIGLERCKWVMFDFNTKLGENVMKGGYFFYNQLVWWSSRLKLYFHAIEKIL